MLTDTHCHLYDEAFQPDFEAVLSRAREAGVGACVMPGIDRSCHEAMLAVADALPGFAFPCIGLHPTSVGENWPEELDFVKTHLGDRRWYAVGEIGLDEYWSKEYVKEQMHVLEEQIVLASRADLPVIIHLREATDDFFRVLEDLRGVDFRGVMHAYSGSYETYRRLLTYADFKFGIGGVVTYKNAGIAAAMEKMSLQDVVLETDCPWLTPVPFRGKRNEPAHVRLVAEKIAQIKRLPLEEVAAVTTAQARALFKL
jgi:TatD DNase family protein